MGEKKPMKHMKKIALLTCLLGLCVVPFQLKGQDAQAFDQAESINHTVHELESLFVLMQERLSLMHEVAKYKWNADLKEATLDDEELILFEGGQENDAFIASFFEAQNNAGHRIQNEDFLLFEKDSIDKFEDVKDFETELSPQLRVINEEMLFSVNQLLVHTQNESLPEFLKDLSFASFQNEGIGREIYNIAVDPLFRD